MENGSLVFGWHGIHISGFLTKNTKHENINSDEIFLWLQFSDLGGYTARVFESLWGMLGP